MLIPYFDSYIHYLQFGEGITTVVALHGYGESAESFRFLNNHLPSEYRIIAIDLPFHGSTEWKESRGFTITDMITIIDDIFIMAGIPGARFILMGYSMGGRVALSLTEQLPARIVRLILLAPDGMAVHFWYWLATQTSQGNRLFRFTMNHPTWFLAMVRAAGRINLVNKSVGKVVSFYINDVELRSKLYCRWICLSGIKPDLKKIRSLIQEKKMRVEMLYGRYDRLVLSHRAEQFCKGLEHCCRLQIIDAGHKLLHQSHAGLIVSLLTA